MKKLEEKINSKTIEITNETVDLECLKKYEEKKSELKLNILICLLMVILSFLTFTFSRAQTVIPEGGFDNWSLSSSSLFEEPTGGWWTTLNSLVQLGAETTVTKTTDAYSGAYAARLETKQWGTFMLTGLLVSGKFINTDPFVIQGKPYTELPKKFKGYYKYTSVDGDSAGIYAMLSKYNSATGKRDTIAEAKTAVRSTVSSYTAFDLDFVYYTPNVNPDSIDIVFCSSSGDSNKVGSTFFIDDISLEYPSGIHECLFPEINVNVFPNPANEQLHLFFETGDLENVSCRLYTMDGKLCYLFIPTNNENIIDIRNFISGKYLLNTYRNNTLISTNKINIAH